MTLFTVLIGICFTAHMNAAQSFPKQSMANRLKFLVSTINQEDPICQLPSFMKVSYVSLEDLTNLKRTLGLTLLQMWHQNLQIEVQNISHMQSKVWKLNSDIRLLHLLLMLKMTFLEILIHYLLSVQNLTLLVSSMRLKKRQRKVTL